jgi:hypothetical protein
LAVSGGGKGGRQDMEKTNLSKYYHFVRLSKTGKLYRTTTAAARNLQLAESQHGELRGGGDEERAGWSVGRYGYKVVVVQAEQTTAELPMP